MLTLNFSEAEIQELNYERFHYPSPIVQKRMHVLFLKSLNISHNDISVMMDVHPNSVTNFIKLFKKGGMAAIKELNFTRPESDLMSYASSFEKEFEKHPPLSSKEAGNTIRLITGLTRCPTQIRAFMKRIGMKCLKLGHIPSKADPVKQKKFVKTVLEPVIEDAKKGKCHLLFLDAAHFVFAPFLCRVWCFARKFIPSPSGRQRLNVLGAIDAVTKELTFLANSTYINAETIVKFLEKLDRVYNDELPLYLVLDNARYQHCEYVKQIADKLHITLYFLPPYSPNLNLIERLWKFTKQNVLYGKYYASFGEFQKSITEFLSKINSSKKLNSELNSLITLNFQTFENSQNLAA
ncbi:MAG: IS630 family transposase [Nitrosopumilus sp.]|nr:IS630 family transposase [Nitrosopumilus sp.]